MKRRITLSIALVLGVAFLSLMSSDSTAKAAPAQRYFADTGTITLGPNQLLRITVACASRRPMTLTVDTIKLAHGICNDSGVCIHTLASRTTTEPVTLMPGESASIDITQTPGSSAVRGGVSLDSPNVQVNALIIDGATGGVSESNKLFVGGLSW